MSRTYTAVFPGSFDPLTNGHVDIITRALSVFDRVVIGVLFNSDKGSLFSAEERVELIRECFADQGDRVAAESFSGLLVDFVTRMQGQVIIRGLRAISDFDYEAQMAHVNRHLSGGVETLFLMTREKYSYVSSSLVRQIAPLGGDIGNLVPEPVVRALKVKYAA